MTTLDSLTLTMSSCEIAALVNKKHYNIARDIRKMLKALELEATNYESTFKDGSGIDRICYELPKDLTLTLVTGYDIKRRHAINKRWLELEEQLRTGELQANQQSNQQMNIQMMDMMQTVTATVAKMSDTLNQMGEMLNRMNSLLEQKPQANQTVVNVNTSNNSRELPTCDEYSPKQVSQCLFTLRLFGEALRTGDIDPLMFPYRSRGEHVVMKSDTITNFLYNQPELYELAKERGIVSSSLITRICKAIGAITGSEKHKGQASHHHFRAEYFV